VRPRGARDRDRPFLERLAQHLERRARKFAEFVEIQHAMLGERDFPRARHRSTVSRSLPDEKGLFVDSAFR
jgi:hypothetical protein